MPRVDRQQRREQMIQDLRNLAEQYGPDIAVTRYCRETGWANCLIYYYFENWGDLRVKAGLPREVDRSRIHARHTEESLIATVRELAAEVGEDVSLKEFYHRTGISCHPVYRLFGDWRSFKRAAGLNKHRKPGLPSEYDRETILGLMKEMVTEHGTRLTEHDFCELTGLSPSTIHKYGGWSRLRRELGLSERGRRSRLAPSDPLNDLLPDLTQLIWDPDEPIL